MLINVSPGGGFPPPLDPTEPDVELKPKNLLYSWDSDFGYLHQVAEIEFPPLAAITKISSNFPVRVRAYKSLTELNQDLNRPPQIAPSTLLNPGLFLEGILSKVGEENALGLAPVALIASAVKVPIIIEKLILDAGRINLRFDFVG